MTFVSIRSTCLGVVALSAVALAAWPAAAHEFIVKPEPAAKGAPRAFSVIVTEVYMKPDRLPPDGTRVELIGGASPDKSLTLELTKDSAAKKLSGAFAMAGEGPRILAATVMRLRKPRIKGQDKAKAAHQPGKAPAGIVKMEAFSKALFDAKSGEALHLRPIGSRLEVVPLVNPADIAPGGTMTVRVLFDGKPVAARVQTTYDGYSDKEHGYVTKTKTGDDGMVELPIEAPGLWLVRTKVKRDEAGADYQRYEASANIVFRVAAR